MEFSIKGLKIDSGSISIQDLDLFRNEGVDELVAKIISEDDLRKKAEYAWVIWESARQLKLFPSSINSFYRARGRGEFSGFTVPAMNLRTLSYDSARAVFRVAKRLNAGAFIFEIARSEIGYTAQRPLEYTAMVLSAGIKEGYQGAVFIQGDHFQLKLKDFQADKDKTIDEIKKLIDEAMAAGFYNIDIDASTLVDLSQPRLEKQQYNNSWVTAELTKYIRDKEIEGIKVSVGGEIGEVGGKNSTPEDLHAFMQEYLKELKGGYEGISKISIQTGTAHGGVVLPDGSIAKVKVDFDTLENLSQIARDDYGMAGAVQHGASTLPKEMFHKFPEVETAEIHLATQFQNIVYEELPEELRNKMYAWVKENCKSEWKQDQTEEQFIYKTRKKALGPFKKELFNLPSEIKSKIVAKLEEEFEFLFRQLRIENTRELVDKHVKPVDVKKSVADLLPSEMAEAHFEGAD
jgi:fructose/tagatose bisphosphate aldolase